MKPYEFTEVEASLEYILKVGDTFLCRI